jgi:hypothetical protein
MSTQVSGASSPHISQPSSSNNSFIASPSHTTTYECSTLSPSTVSSFVHSDEEYDLFKCESTGIKNVVVEDELPCIDALLNELDGIDKPMSESFFTCSSQIGKSDWGVIDTSPKSLHNTDFDFCDFDLPYDSLLQLV